MRLYYIANARMPTEKAHGIQIAKMCEAFTEAGIDVTLIVPSRKTTPESIQDFYRLRTPIKMLKLPVPDLYLYGTPGYRMSSYVFMLEYVLLLWWKKVCGEQFAMYTVDLDNFSSSALVLVPATLYSEMHGGKPNSFMQRVLFKKASGIFAINSIIVKELKEKFPRSKAVYAVEPNGVDASDFLPIDKLEARAKLGLPSEAKIALYAGRFFDWKGLEIFPQAAALTSGVEWYMVGGDEKHFKEFVHEPIPSSIRFLGSRPHQEMPLWLAAADALLVLGTRRDMQSYYYTSPMKLFEYLLAKRPIVASNTPAIRDIVSEREVFLYEPDDAQDLARKVAYAIAEGADEKTADALTRGKTYSWSTRAKRIQAFIKL